jgi:hypothetical protein
VDPTLTVSGDAADAKVVGDNFADVKSAINALKITDTASGAIASFPDGAAMPVESLTVELEPIQDLNGQDAPYPAGGGRNLIPTYVEDGSSNGITWKVNADETLTVNGTATATLTIEAPVSTWQWDGETACWLSGCPDGGNMNTGYSLRVNGSLASDYSAYDTGGSGTSFRPYTSSAHVDGTILRFCIVIRSGTVCNNLVFKPQLEYGTAKTDFMPYSNICPITGRESVTVVRTGKNLLEKPAVYYATIGKTLSDCFFVKAGEYNFSVASMRNATSWRWGIMLKDKNGADLSDNGHRPNQYMTWNNPNKFWLGGANGTNKSVVFNAVEDCYIRIIFAVGDTSASTIANDAQLELGSTATAYEAPRIQSVTIQLGTTVYGGTLDVNSGVLTVDRAMVDLGTLDWITPTDNRFYTTSLSSVIKKGTDGALWIQSSIFHATSSLTNVYNSLDAMWLSSVGNISISKIADTATALKTAVTGQQLVYELATQFTIQLTAQQMTTLKGQNNVWSDADSVEVEYVADPKLYIARLTEPDADMVADANITSGSYFMVGNSLYLATSNIASGSAIVPGVNCTRTNLASALNAINS